METKVKSREERGGGRSFRAFSKGSNVILMMNFLDQIENRMFQIFLFRLEYLTTLDFFFPPRTRVKNCRNVQYGRYARPYNAIN